MLIALRIRDTWKSFSERTSTKVITCPSTFRLANSLFVITAVSFVFQNIFKIYDKLCYNSNTFFITDGISKNIMAVSYSIYPFQVFRVVAGTGSITKAARELFISQPAVSAHIKAVEKRFGQVLFERTPKGVELTSVGREVLNHVNRLFALYEEIPSVVDAANNRVHGEVVVAASSTPGAYRVPALLMKFQQKYPEVSPRLCVGDTEDVLEWLQEYRFALAVVGEMHAKSGLHKLEIGFDELVLVASPDCFLVDKPVVKAKDLQKLTLFIREHGSSTREATVRLLGDFFHSFGRVVEISDTEAIKQSVIHGLGVAVLSSWSFELEHKSSLLRPVMDKKMRKRRKFYLVRRQDRVLNGNTAALWNYLKEQK